MKLMLQLMALMVLVTTLFTGCGQNDAENSKTKIYFIAKASESEFWQVVMDGARSAGEELGAKVVIQAPVAESDIDKQISIFNTAALTKPAAFSVRMICSKYFTDNRCLSAMSFTESGTSG